MEWGHESAKSKNQISSPDFTLPGNILCGSLWMWGGGFVFLVNHSHRTSRLHQHLLVAQRRPSRTERDPHLDKWQCHQLHRFGRLDGNDTGLRLNDSNAAGNCGAELHAGMHRHSRHRLQDGHACAFSSRRSMRHEPGSACSGFTRRCGCSQGSGQWNSRPTAIRRKVATSPLCTLRCASSSSALCINGDCSCPHGESFLKQRW